MQLIKRKIILFDDVSLPSKRIQQLTFSFFELIPQIMLPINMDDVVGIICKSNGYHQSVDKFSPDIPVLTEEQWLNIDHLDRFLVQVYTLQRFEHLLRHLTAHEVILFHSRYKYLIMAYSPTGYQLTGKLVAEMNKGKASSRDLNTSVRQYKEQVMHILAKTPEKKSQVNALSHMQGYFKHKATKDEKKRLLWLINDYREGHISINYPLAMLRQLLIQYPDDYLSQQYYLEPYPNCEQVRELFISDTDAAAEYIE